MAETKNFRLAGHSLPEKIVLPKIKYSAFCIKIDKVIFLYK